MSGGSRFISCSSTYETRGYDVTGITLKLYDDNKKSKEGAMLWTRYS